MHFRGVEQASAPIYINGSKNTRFFKNYAKQAHLILSNQREILY